MKFQSNGAILNQEEEKSKQMIFIMIMIVIVIITIIIIIFIIFIIIIMMIMATLTRPRQYGWRATGEAARRDHWPGSLNPSRTNLLTTVHIIINKQQTINNKPAHLCSYYCQQQTNKQQTCSPVFLLSSTTNKQTINMLTSVVININN